MKRFLLAAIVLCGAACAIRLVAQVPNRDEVIIDVREPEPKLEDAAHTLPGMIYGPLRPDGSRDISYRQDAIGQRVTVEGLAWGSRSEPKKGQEGTVSPWAGSQVIHQCGSTFVKGIPITERGKPVRVTGTLRLQPAIVTRSPPTAGLKAYYFIEATSCESLDAVTDPYLVLMKE